MDNFNKQKEKQELCAMFQDTVLNYLIRHQSILDIITKFQEATSRTNRALVKSVTTCGCIKIMAEKQKLPDNISLAEMRDHINTHLVGQVCDECQDIIEEEIGTTLFYLTALCNALGLNLEEIVNKEQVRIRALGIYGLR